jgi:endonuclease YncB( thermonuclease family)
MAAPYQVARAQSLRTIDGDTIVIGKTHYRLWGIDAPETKQWCGDYPAGIQATATLEYLMKPHTVTCEVKGYDRYGRTIGLCRADGDDLSQAMVELGMAWAFSRYSHDYEPQEARARRENLGIWAHGCEPAWDWRSAHKK